MFPLPILAHHHPVGVARRLDLRGCTQSTVDVVVSLSYIDHVGYHWGSLLCHVESHDTSGETDSVSLSSVSAHRWMS